MGIHKKFLKDFVETGKIKEIKAYAHLVTEMLSDKQIEALDGFFNVSLTVKPQDGKEAEMPPEIPRVAQEIKEDGEKAIKKVKKEVSNQETRSVPVDLEENDIIGEMLEEQD